MGWQESTGQWDCGLPSPVDTVPLQPKELSKAKAEDQGSRGGSRAQEKSPVVGSSGSLSPGSCPAVTAEVLLLWLSVMDWAGMGGSMGSISSLRAMTITW